MAVARVTLTASDEQFAPAGHEIELSVIGNDVLITVYTGSLEDLKDGRKKAYEVPPLDVKELLAALNAFADGSLGWRFERKSA